MASSIVPWGGYWVLIAAEVCTLIASTDAGEAEFLKLTNAADDIDWAEIYQVYVFTGI